MILYNNCNALLSELVLPDKSTEIRLNGLMSSVQNDISKVKTGFVELSR